MAASKSAVPPLNTAPTEAKSAATPGQAPAATVEHSIALPVAATVRDEGWAVGTTDGSEWLTIIGSHYERRVVFATREGAEERAVALRERTVEPHRASIIVRRVQRLGGLYNRILPDTD